MKGHSGGPFILETLKRYTGSLTSKGVPDGYSNTHFILYVVQHYQFWIFNYRIQEEKLTIPAAVGNGDQRIYFDSRNNLLTVTTAGNYNKWNIENNASAIFKNIYNSFTFKEIK